jgi:hypothetical protein
MVDIRQFLTTLQVPFECIAEEFNIYLSDVVKKRISDLDKIVIEIPPQPALHHSITTPIPSSSTHSGLPYRHMDRSERPERPERSDRPTRHPPNHHTSHSVGGGGGGGGGGRRPPSNSHHHTHHTHHPPDHRRRPGYEHGGGGGRYPSSSLPRPSSSLSRATEADITGDWNIGKSFKPTKMMTKEGIEKDMNEIRISLNKISNKNYDTHRDTILSLVDNFIEDAMAKEMAAEEAGTSETGPETGPETDALGNIRKIAQFIFDIASSNKFYGEIYADLYKELVCKFVVFRTILNEMVFTYKDSINTLRYVDSNVDYDAYCEYNKINEKRRASASFLVLLTTRTVLDPSILVELILHFQSVFTMYISEENRTNEVDEITELLFILITIGKDLLGQLPEWENIILPGVITASKLKAKEQRSLSSRAVFKYMDLHKKVTTTTT